MKKIWTFYLSSYAKVLLYMLQTSEYNVGDYLDWFHRTRDFRKVMKRQQLDWTNKIKFLALAEAFIIFLLIILSLTLASVWSPLWWLVLLVYPWLLAYGLVVPLGLGELFIQRPREKKIIESAKKKLAAHQGRKIAIAGSYGKTTTKEVLRTVLAEKYKVAATPGNMNTPIGTSRFIQALGGEEEILIFEMGESHVGDIRELCELIQPDIGVLTGINQAHLKTFKTIDNIVATIFELQEYLREKPLYNNYESELIQKKLSHKDEYSYDRHSIGGWTLTKSVVSLQGTEFTIKKAEKTVEGTSALIGEHVLGTLLLAVAVADSFDMSATQINEGLKKVKPFEHRMEPRHLHGAWLIDDTYNGNVRGIEAGLQLLKDSGAKRRVYVTPGLVEQGHETKSIHNHIGRLIAESADMAVLMRNSVTDYIIEGLKDADFTGELQIVDEPLEFYTGIEHFIAAGDVVLMQNDWTDNYV